MYSPMIKRVVYTACFGVMLGASVLLSGCASLHSADLAHPLVKRFELLESAELRTCAQFFSALDREVAEAGVGDGGASRIPGYPYLRVDRFLNSFKQAAMERFAFDAWVERMQTLDREARRAEIANLPQLSRQRLSEYSPDGSPLTQTMRRCGDTLQRADLTDVDTRQRLLRTAQAPSEYRNLYRVLGVYPLSALFVSQGIARWHEKTQRIFGTPLEVLPVRGEIHRYLPPAEVPPLSSVEIASVLARGARNPLGIPEPDAIERERLFATFAPVWEVDTVSDNDRLGGPHWSEGAVPEVDISRPSVYRHLSHTRFQDQILLQLNYVAWFPARPKSGALDILGGRLDGITWRVTLAPNGRPLVYDSMHNCGCYHMFFPTRGLRLKERDSGFEEPPLIPQQAPEWSEEHRVILRIASRTHYLQRVYTTPVSGQGTLYRWADYHELRSLPLPGEGHRSLFRTDGIVSGTERGERFLLWPMGVPAPGAMRQWGHHATAFVGRRHFDDAHLLERYFAAIASSREGGI